MTKGEVKYPDEPNTSYEALRKQAQEWKEQAAFWQTRYVNLEGKLKDLVNRYTK